MATKKRREETAAFLDVETSLLCFANEMANRKRTFTTRSCYAVLARMDDMSDDDSISDFECSSEEELFNDEEDGCIFDIPGKFLIEQYSIAAI